MKLCEDCQLLPSIPRERFCKGCKRLIVERIREDERKRYRIKSHRFRGTDAREDEYETRHV